MHRSLPCLLLVLLAAPTRAAADEPVVARMGQRVEPGAAPNALDVAMAAARSPGDRVRIVDLRDPVAGIAEIRDRQLPRILALRPRVVALSLGSADVCGTVPLRAFARELHVVTELLSRNAHRTVIETIADPGERCARSGAGLRRRLDAFNWTILQTAARNKLRVLDVRGTGDAARGSLDPTLVAEIEDALGSGRGGRGVPSPRPEPRPGRGAL